MHRYEDLRKRTGSFALAVVRLCREVPRTTEGFVIGKQLLRSGTSVAANYRAVQRARSRAEFASKMGIVVEEADETQFWLELLEQANIMDSRRLAPVKQEVTELLAIFTASYRTVKS